MKHVKLQTKPDIHRLLELQRLVLQLHTIERSVRHPADFDRHETDTEHSYTLAMAGWFLAQYFHELDQHKVIQLALVHDLLEIHAGDTMAYAKADVLQGKAERERAAIDKLVEEWPDFPELATAIHEYEARQSNEAKFVYALDKLMPVVLNYLNQGRTWQHEGITFERLVAEKEAKIRLSPEAFPYYQQLIATLQVRPDFFPATPAPSSPSQQI